MTVTYALQEKGSWPHPNHTLESEGAGWFLKQNQDAVPRRMGGLQLPTVVTPEVPLGNIC